MSSRYVLSNAASALSMNSWTMQPTKYATRFVKEDFAPKPSGQTGSFFYLKSAAEPSMYVVPLQSVSSITDDTSFVFAFGDKSSAIIFQQESSEPLRMWLGVDDSYAKGMCVVSSAPHRVYKAPFACEQQDGMQTCPLSWQTCNMKSGFCFDSTLLTKQTSVQGNVTQSSLSFPNCAAGTKTKIQPLLSLVEVDSDASPLSNDLSQAFDSFGPVRIAIIGIIIGIVVIALFGMFHHHAKTENTLQQYQQTVLGFR